MVPYGHFYLLLPCGFLSESGEETVRPKTVRKPRTRQTPSQMDEKPSSSNNKDKMLLLLPSEITFETKLPEVLNIPGVQCKTLLESVTPTGLDNLPESDTPTGMDKLPEVEPVEREHDDEGFNQVVVDTFENNVLKEVHEGTHVI